MLKNHYIGLMSGTSLDGVDAALCAIDENQFLTLNTLTLPYPEELLAILRPLSQNSDINVAALLVGDHRLAEFYADAVRQLLHPHAAVAIAAIGCHGQTIRHSPDTRPATTWQIGDPNVLVQATGLPVVADFRRRDMAAGGQGAPLVPAFHAWRFRQSGETRAIVNIGGIANVTVIPPDDADKVIGFDTGPGNTLLNAWIRQHRDEPMDRGGHWAASGIVNDHLLESLLSDPYFKRPSPKSTGPEHFNLDWLQDRVDGLRPEDVQATLCALTARSVAAALRPHTPTSVYVCGGGVHNTTLMTLLERELAPSPVATTEKLGVDPDYVEAAAFAWLAHRTLNDKPGNLPSVTGARTEVVLGGVYYP